MFNKHNYKNKLRDDMSSAASADNSAVRHVDIALYNSGKVLDDKANNKKDPDLNLANGGKVGEDLLKDLLKTYEKAKLKMAGALLQGSVDLKNSDLGQAMQNDPVFQSLMQVAPDKDPAPPEALKNFFYEIFQFLKDHKEDDSKLQVAQAMNMIAKQGVLDNVTQESVAALGDMKTKIAAADIQRQSDDKGNSFLEIGLPIILAVVSVAIVCASAGLAAPAAAAADGAVDGAQVVSVGARASTALSTATTLGMVVTPVCTKYSSPDAAVAQADSDYGHTISNASSIEQGIMAINAAATDSSQNDIKQDMNYQQNAQSEIESDASMELQTINLMAKCNSTGNF